ncbi:MAG: hypothetical protein ACRDY7_05985 [Acidimicrobiia bacterium]
MVTIRIDPDRLEQMARDLRLLHGEFESLEQRVEDHEATVGHHRVVDALDELAGNWSDDRGTILERIQALADNAQRLADHYRNQDTSMGQSFAGTGGGGSSAR